MWKHNDIRPSPSLPVRDSCLSPIKYAMTLLNKIPSRLFTFNPAGNLSDSNLVLFDNTPNLCFNFA